MINQQRIHLWEDLSANNGSAQRPSIDVYSPEPADSKPRPGILIIPGGGYFKLFANEGAPVAEWFAGQGFVSAVLTYRLSPDRFPGPLADAARAVRLFKANAGAWQMDIGNIGLIGFSAGGHLATTLATQPDFYHEPEDQLAGTFDSRPDRLILAYPVISFEEYGHSASALNLLGDNPDPVLLHQLSNQHFVTGDNPPVFLFHTANDPRVAVQNSLMFADACIRKSVPTALHIYPDGPHATALGQDFPELSDWPFLMLKWCNNHQL